MDSIIMVILIILCFVLYAIAFFENDDNGGSTGHK